MATKKDLVEAHAFSRRRLVTAFLSGAPGGREVEPSRPGRTIVGGIALAVLLVAGAAIASVLASRTEEDWNKPGLVISREQGAPYVILEKSDPPELRPVSNITSAQLLLGADLPPTYVTQDVIDQQVPGEDIGIFGAPQQLPKPESFIQSGWTACTGDDLGLAVDVAREPQVTTLGTDSAFLVRSEGRYYVIATSRQSAETQRAYRYRVFDEPSQDSMLGELDLPNRADAIDVPGSWLRLFPEGGDLGFDSFGIDDVGAEAPGDAPEGAHVGDYLVTGDTGLVLTEDGPARLDEFALIVYEYSSLPGKGDRSVQPNRLPEDTPPPQGGQVATIYDDAHWPEAPDLRSEPGAACAVLEPQRDDVPVVALGTEPRGSASAADLGPEDDRRPTVTAGGGAYVRSGGFDDSSGGSPYVIDSKGDIYPLLGTDTLEKLGYASTSAPVVPDTWVKLFDQGVALSTSAARCPPAPPQKPARNRVCEE